MFLLTIPTYLLFMLHCQWVANIPVWPFDFPLQRLVQCRLYYFQIWWKLPTSEYYCEVNDLWTDILPFLWDYCGCLPLVTNNSYNAVCEWAWGLGDIISSSIINVENYIHIWLRSSPYYPVYRWYCWYWPRCLIRVIWTKLPLCSDIDGHVINLWFPLAALNIIVEGNGTLNANGTFPVPVIFILAACPAYPLGLFGFVSVLTG